MKDKDSAEAGAGKGKKNKPYPAKIGMAGAGDGTDSPLPKMADGGLSPKQLEANYRLNAKKLDRKSEMGYMKSEQDDPSVVGGVLNRGKLAPAFGDRYKVYENEKAADANRAMADRIKANAEPLPNEDDDSSKYANGGLAKRKMPPVRRPPMAAPPQMAAAPGPALGPSPGGPAGATFARPMANGGKAGVHGKGLQACANGGAVGRNGKHC